MFDDCFGMIRPENIPSNLIWIIPAQGYASYLTPLLCHYFRIPRLALLILSSCSLPGMELTHRRSQFQYPHTLRNFSELKYPSSFLPTCTLLILLSCIAFIYSSVYRPYPPLHLTIRSSIEIDPPLNFLVIFIIPSQTSRWIR